LKFGPHLPKLSPKYQQIVFYWITLYMLPANELQCQLLCGRVEYVS